MKSAIKILTIISAVIAGISTIALLVMIFAQKPFALAIFGTKIAKTVIPATQTIYALGALAVCVLLCVAAGNKHISVCVEIISAITLGGVLPLLQKIISPLEFIAANRAGIEQTAALSTVQNLAGYALIFMPVAVALALIACGMSICYKKLGTH